MTIVRITFSRWTIENARLPALCAISQLADSLVSGRVIMKWKAKTKNTGSDIARQSVEEWRFITRWQICAISSIPERLRTKVKVAILQAGTGTETVTKMEAAK